VSRGDVRLATGVSFDVDTSGDADCRATASRAVMLAPGATLTSAAGVSFSSSASAADSSTYLLTAPQLHAISVNGVGVTHVAGDTTIAGGSFVGLLIVDGVLTITGPFTASGLIVSRGPIVALNGGLAVTGVMMSFAPPSVSQPAIDVGPANFFYSRCAVIGAIRRAVPLRPVRERSWAELF
jgi:hypothetical protein